MDANKKHEIFRYFDRVSQDIDDSFQDIQRCQKRDFDAGTAGARGENVWATLFREWLPSDLKIVTTGRILYPDGNTSGQMDILILSPDYPTGLMRKNSEYFMSSGVLAAFESRNTIKSKDIKEAIRDAESIKGHGLNIYSSHSFLWPIYGLLGLNHGWKKNPEKSIRKNLTKPFSSYVGEMTSTFPSFLPDICCVANISSFYAETALCSHANNDKKYWIEISYRKAPFESSACGLIWNLWDLLGCHPTRKKRNWLNHFISNAGMSCMEQIKRFTEYKEHEPPMFLTVRNGLGPNAFENHHPKHKTWEWHDIGSKTRFVMRRYSEKPDWVPAQYA